MNVDNNMSNTGDEFTELVMQFQQWPSIGSEGKLSLEKSDIHSETTSWNNNFQKQAAPLLLWW